MCIICHYLDDYNSLAYNTDFEHYLERRFSKNYSMLVNGWLDVSNCTMLKKIPKIKGIRRLDCSNCPLLEEISVIDGLYFLDCSECPRLKEIPVINGLLQLFCDHCTSLTKLPNITGLHCLHCSRCPLLTELPNINDLCVLTCDNCQNGLQNLCCDFCTMIETVPHIVGLYKLFCRGCDKIQEIPKIQGLAVLACSGCSRIKEISCPMAFVTCNGCSNLRIIECDDSESRTNANDCPNLFYSPWHTVNKQKIDRLRKFIRNNFKYFVFKHWIRSKEFCEHYYSPQNRVGKMMKRGLESFVREMTQPIKN
jgi:hypothetical protein